MFTLEEIREHLQDKPNRNYLLDEEEFTSGEIDIGFKAAISGFNSIAPTSITIDIKSINDTIKDIILEGILARIYRGKSLQHFRNELSFQDGGASGSIDNKGQFYQQIATQMWADFERRSKEYKIFTNLDEGYGKINSDYNDLPSY